MWEDQVIDGIRLCQAIHFRRKPFTPLIAGMHWTLIGRSIFFRRRDLVAFDLSTGDGNYHTFVFWSTGTRRNIIGGTRVDTWR